MRKAMIPPVEDFCGKIIFENPTVLRYFISAVLKIPVEKLKNVWLIDSFLHRLFPRDKEGILDVLVELEDGRKINIEIQVEQMKYWDRRSLFYLAKLFTRRFRRGGNYKDLKACVNISILDYDYLDTDSYHSTVRLCYGNGKIYSDAMELHVIELRKLKRWKVQFMKENSENGDAPANKSEKESLVVDEYEQEVQEWVEFFRCKTEKEVEELSVQTKNPGIREAIKELMSVNAGSVFEARFQEKLKMRRDKVAREDFVREESSKDTKREDILDLLGEYGEISETLKNQIMKEQDLKRLKNLFRLAAKADSIEGFEEAMNSEKLQ